MLLVTMNPLGETQWEHSSQTEMFMADLGRKIADDAAARAPRDSGRLADSIGYETGIDSKGAWVRVSWTDDVWYGIFPELGTSQTPARPFLRPAVQKRRHL